VVSPRITLQRHIYHDDAPRSAPLRRLRAFSYWRSDPLFPGEGNTLSCNSFTPSMTAATLDSSL